MKEAVQEASREELQRLVEPEVVAYTSEFVRRLLAERERIYARLHNPGGSVILTSVAAELERGEEYSGAIGNAWHLDLIDLDVEMQKLSKAERDALETWANDLTSTQAAPLMGVKGKIRVASPEAVRQRRSRAIRKLTDNLNEASDDSG